MRLISFLVLISISISQSFHNHPELEWHTFETEHFIFSYHNETERSCREAATVAESIYFPVTQFYDFEPDSKTHIILKDTDDYANGAAYYYDNKIEIWALPLDFNLRGSHRWLQNVITHEFIHIVQIGAAMKYPRRFPAGFIQVMGYEDEKRPDVLYGYPNTIISYPIPGVAVPPWMAEGTAQFMYDGANYDYWDSHRDMTLRDRVLNDDLLSFNAMNSFGKRGLGNESTYSMGFRFSQYLSNRFGLEVLRKITDSLSSPLNYSISIAIQKATGISGNELYDDWVLSINDEYTDFGNKIEKIVLSGEIIEYESTTNIFPVWSPDGKRFAFLSNKNNDYFGQTNLYVYSFEDSTSEKIVGGVKMAPTWMNDSTIVYTHRSDPDLNGSKFFDLYKININNQDYEPEQLTYSARLYSPVYMPEKNQIAAINMYDGTSNVLLSDADSIDFKPITHFENGIYMPSLSWNGEKLFTDAIIHQTRNLYSIDFFTGELIPEIQNEWDERSISFQNNMSVHARDKSGVFNLYYSHDDEHGYITNVPGGAFMPSISTDGRILYSEFKNGGYKIAIIDSIQFTNNNEVGYAEDYWMKNPQSLPITNLDSTVSKPYNETMSQLSIMPRVMLDYETVKPGIYFTSHDYLDRLSIFGGASINSKSDLDLFLIFEFKKYWPTLYSNLFWVTRHRDMYSNYTRANGTIADNVDINSELAFILFSGEIGTRFNIDGHKFWIDYNYTNYREHVNQKVVQNAPYDTLRFNGDLAFDYYRGHGASIKYKYELIKPAFLNNMFPGNGFLFNAKLGYEWNSFMNGFGVNEEYSTFGANFSPNNTYRFTLNSMYHFTLNQSKRWVSSLGTQLGWLSNNEVDNFFHFFSGGLPGLKGYTFYNEDLTGSRQIIVTSETRIPIFLEKNHAIAHLNIQNMSVGMVVQAGGSFNNQFSEFIKESNYKFSTGLEMRIHGFSFYSYPTAFEYEYHQAFNDSAEAAKHYLSILFGF